MNLRFYIICVAVVLALVVPAAADNNTATVHGEIYGWDTFEPLENAIVNVNSTPAQSMVAKYGVYSFELKSGNYSITAKYYENNTTVYSATELITIGGEGSYRLDLLLLPVYSEALMEGSEVNVSSKNSTPSAGSPVTEVPTGKTNSSNSFNIPEQIIIYSSTVSPLLMVLTLFLLLAAGYHFSKKRKKPVINATLKEKAGDIYRDSSGLRNMPESPVKVQDKSIDHESEQDLQVNAEKTVSTAGQVARLESGTPATEPVIGPEALPPITGLVVKSESKVSTAGQVTEPFAAGQVVTELESSIADREVLVENKGGYPAQEIEPEEPETEEENRKNSLNELADNPLIKVPAPVKKLPLPADLQDVMDIIRGQGGRITQKDLRSKLKYSEGKVSLMLADLERRDLIEKFKRGRGNVVILKDEER